MKLDQLLVVGREAARGEILEAFREGSAQVVAAILDAFGKHAPCIIFAFLLPAFQFTFFSYSDFTVLKANELYFISYRPVYFYFKFIRIALWMRHEF